MNLIFLHRSLRKTHTLKTHMTQTTNMIRSLWKKIQVICFIHSTNKLYTLNINTSFMKITVTDILSLDQNLSSTTSELLKFTETYLICWVTSVNIQSLEQKSTWHSWFQFWMFLIWSTIHFHQNYWQTEKLHLFPSWKYHKISELLLYLIGFFFNSEIFFLPSSQLWKKFPFQSFLGNTTINSMFRGFSCYKLMFVTPWISFGSSGKN